MIMNVIFEQDSKVSKIHPPALYFSHMVINCSSLFMSISNLILPHNIDMKKHINMCFSCPCRWVRKMDEVVIRKEVVYLGRNNNNIFLNSNYLITTLHS